MADISTGRQRGIVPFVDETTGRLPDQYLPQGVIDLQGDLEQAVTDASASATAAKASETAAKSSADSATQSASAAAQSAESASGDAAAAKASADGAASSASAAKASETAAASNAAAAAESEAAAKESETAASQSAQTATEQVSSIGDSVERAASSATAAQQSATEAASSASNASQSASSASTSASQAGESASQANGFASTASQAATTATGAASNASESATTAQQSASEASVSASAAKISETNAAASATAAQQAVDGFGLEVGTTTTGEPGTNAAVEIQKNGTKYTANFTIPRGDVGPAGVNENVPLGSTSGVVAQASDAYPALPRKVQVHGATSGVNTVEPEKLIYASKNIISPFKEQTRGGITVSPSSDGGFTLKGTSTAGGTFIYRSNRIPIPFGVKHVYAYTDKAPQFVSQDGSIVAFQVIQDNDHNAQVKFTNFDKGTLVEIADTAKFVYFQIYAKTPNVQCVENVVYHPQIEFSDSFNGFSKPEEIQEIKLPEGISLADGDTLVIDRDGTTRIVHAEGEPTVLENVTLPELPAPTFNVYATGGYIQPTIDVDYERDVNLVLEALEAKIAALQVADKTN